MEYEEIKKVNHSSLSWFEVSPRFYYAMLNGLIRIESTSYFDLGEALHCAILQPTVFSDRYVVVQGVVPSHAYHVNFCKLVSESSTAKDAYSAVYSIKGKKESDIIKAAEELYKQYEEYIECIKKSKDKLLISKEDADKIELMKNSLINHKKANQLLFSDFEIIQENPQIEIRIEFPIEFDWPKIQLPCKSKLDKVFVNHKDKIITIIDLKTTSKSICKFALSCKKFNYPRQLGFYTMSVIKHAEENRIDLSGWMVNWYIVAVETSGLYECRVFSLSDKQIETGYKESYELLCRIQEHERRGVWDYSLEYYDGNGDEPLILDENDNDEDGNQLQ